MTKGLEINSSQESLLALSQKRQKRVAAKYAVAKLKIDHDQM